MCVGSSGTSKTPHQHCTIPYKSTKHNTTPWLFCTAPKTQNFRGTKKCDCLIVLDQNNSNQDWRWRESNLSLKSLTEESLKKLVSHANLYQRNTTYAIVFLKIQLQVPFCFKIMPVNVQSWHLFHALAVLLSWNEQDQLRVNSSFTTQPHLPVKSPKSVQSNQEGDTQQWDRKE